MERSYPDLSHNSVQVFQQVAGDEAQAFDLGQHAHQLVAGLAADLRRRRVVHLRSACRSAHKIVCVLSLPR